MGPENKHIYGLIMAGGVGSRFWPESRETRPKQFLDILGTGRSLLRMSFERLLPVIPAENIRILTHEKYSAMVLEQIPEIGAEQLMLEPSRNNTAPCIAYAALKLEALDPESILVVTPADHVILKEQLFLDRIRLAADYAREHSALVTLGIQPTRPDTGYGYIRYEKQADEAVHQVRQFTEKPDRQTAEAFIRSGEYLWNAGIFIWRSKDILASFDQYAPEIINVLAPGKALFNTPKEGAFIKEAYPRTLSISIDYAIMEKAKNVFTIPADIAWSDLGTWNSVYEERPQDDSGNVIDGNVIAPDTTGSLIRMPNGKLAVIRGLEDYIVVDDRDVLLIWPRSEEQAIKQIRDKVDPEYL